MANDEASVELTDLAHRIMPFTRLPGLRCSARTQSVSPDSLHQR